MRHSNANEVKILAREHPGLYQLIIEDNGTSDERIRPDGDWEEYAEKESAGKTENARKTENTELCLPEKNRHRRPEALHLPLPWLRCKRTDKMPWSLTEYSPGIHQSPKSPAPTVSFPALRAGILKLIHWESCGFCNHSGRQCLKENTILILFRYSLHSHSPLSYCTSGNAG